MDVGASRARRVGLAHSLLGALCSAIYLFPYKRAGALSSPDVLAYALLIVAALSNGALYLYPRYVGQRGSRPSQTPDRRAFWTASALLSLLTISGNFCGAQAVTRLEPAVTSVLLRTEIVFVGVFAALLVRERLTLPLGAGALVALGGLLVMRWPLAFDGAGAGALWALGAAASFGMMQVLTRRVIGRISPIAVNACRLWIAVGLLTLVPGLASAALDEGLEFWRFVALAGLFGPFLGRLFIMYSLRVLRAAHSALLLLLAPVLAFAIGFVLQGSVPTGLEVAGGLIILAGVALPSLAGLRAERRASK
ncbi:MAG TPA: DMT family transporter [Polyangiaceae bacterium]|nr:DMT family transporter [Polyangiaceae bacterium]